MISGSTRMCEGGSRRSDQHNTEMIAQFFDGAFVLVAAKIDILFPKIGAGEED